MRVFLSHAHSDAPLANRIASELSKNGIEVWDADRELLPGDNPASETARALAGSEAMVVLLTPSALNSLHVMREMSFALGAKKFKNRLIPVAIRSSGDSPMEGVPWIVRKLPWVELEDIGVEVPDVTPIAEAILSHA